MDTDGDMDGDMDGVDARSPAQLIRMLVMVRAGEQACGDHDRGDHVRSERSAMSAERRETNASLVTLQKESTQAMLSMATAVDAMREWLKEHWREVQPPRRPRRK